MVRFPPPLPLGSTRLDFADRAYVMGVVNVTPDSFSDGGEFLDADAAIAHGKRLAEQGADILDIGGESTRPGAAAVTAEEEIMRVVPVIEGLAPSFAVSIDTTKARVAEAAVAAGAVMINDISAGRMDPPILEVAARRDVPIVLSHMRGTPRDMQDDPTYDDVVADVTKELGIAADSALQAGVPREHIVLDPGIGFGKTVEHNLKLLAHLRVVSALGFAVLVGTSRKSFIGHILAKAPNDREAGTAATVAIAIAEGANLVRVHDVGTMVDVVRIADAVVRARAA